MDTLLSLISRGHEDLLGLGYEDLTSHEPLFRMSSWHVVVSWAVLPLVEQKFLWARCQSPAYAIGSRLLTCDGPCRRIWFYMSVLVAVNIFGFCVADE